MITKTGTGAHGSEAVFDTSSLPAGFYQTAVSFEATGLPPSSGLALSLVGTPVPVTVAVTAAAPKSANASALLYFEPGASFSFSVTPFGSIGASTPAWTAKFFLLRPDDVS